MLKIRLQRVGRKHEPVFRLVLTDSKNSTKSGKYLENLGNFDSRRGEKSEFKTDRVSYWMSKGAQVTPTVHNLLIDKKVISGKKVNVLPLKKAIVKDAPPAVEAVSTTEAPAVETPKEVVEETLKVEDVPVTVVEETKEETPTA